MVMAWQTFIFYTISMQISLIQLRNFICVPELDIIRTLPLYFVILAKECLFFWVNGFGFIFSFCVFFASCVCLLVALFLYSSNHWTDLCSKTGLYTPIEMKLNEKLHTHETKNSDENYQFIWNDFLFTASLNCLFSTLHGAQRFVVVFFFRFGAGVYVCACKSTSLSSPSICLSSIPLARWDLPVVIESIVRQIRLK